MRSRVFVPVPPRHPRNQDRALYISLQPLQPIMLPFAIPYPPEQSNGFWGPPTSTIDWCEENYVVSTYIAEALNTVTNSVFILLALFATYQAWKQRLEPRFIFASLGFMLVGVGLWLFHMTLQYHYQLLDELPMIYATCIPFWSVFSTFKDGRGQWVVAGGISAAAALLTAIYLVLKDPTIHQAAYGAMNVVIILKSISLSREHVDDPRAKQVLYRMLGTGVGLFGFGYFLWNLDIHFCSFARATRRNWGMPYGFVLEGHGWWHIFTGAGVYCYIVYEEYLRCFLIGTAKYYRFTLVWGLPVVECIDVKGLEKYRLGLKRKKD